MQVYDVTGAFGQFQNIITFYKTCDCLVKAPLFRIIDRASQ